MWVATLGLLALASFEAVGALPQAGRELSATVAAGRRVLELTDREPRVSDPPDPIPAPPARPVLALEHVSAGYGDEPSVIDDLSLRLDPGRRIALVGPSGAGKTTVGQPLLRFLDPRGGSVTLDGQDLRRYRLEDVRRTLAVAGQDSHVFATSIRENVRWRGPVRPMTRSLRCFGWRASTVGGVAARRLGHDGGEEGGWLSGGQRQRITIARALLVDAPILVLDEPTAHLDSDTAARLIDDVLAATEGRSLLLITHRPEGLDRMHTIVRLGE